jgi:stalled ribosome rescue protein Dom34
LTEDKFEKEKIRLTPEEGFDLVGIDYFADSDNQLYLVEHFDRYQDALNAKKERRNSEDYFILYKGAGGEYLCR